MAGAWTRKEGKNPEGGLNAKGRASARAGAVGAGSDAETAVAPPVQCVEGPDPCAEGDRDDRRGGLTRSERYAMRRDGAFAAASTLGTRS